MIKKLTATRKTLIALLAAVCLTFLTIGMVSLFYDGTAALTANAETSDDYVSVSSFDGYLETGENETYYLKAGNYQLSESITGYSSNLNIAAESTVIIDLNGYTLSFSDSAYLSNSGTLTIEDSSSSGSGIITTTSTGDYDDAIVNYSTGILYINGGTITVTTGSLEAISNYGTAYINGGTIIGSKDGIYQCGDTLYINGGIIKSIDDTDTSWESVFIDAGTVYMAGGTLNSNDTGIFVRCGIANVSGGTINAANGSGIIVNGKIEYNDGSVTYKTAAATISGTVVINAKCGILVDGGGSVTVSGGTINGTAEGVLVYGPGAVEGDQIYTTLTINGGTIYGQTYGVVGNGTEPTATSEKDYRYTTIVINDGTIIGGATGIYHPQTGDLTVNGGSITGLNSAIEIRSGSLTITGGTFTATYEGDDAGATANGSGTTVVGAAIGISQHTTENELTVVITGGTFDGIYAVYESDTVKSSTATDKGEISATITGGTFNGNVASTTSTTTGEEGETTTYALTITGGTYSDTTASTYTAEGVTLPTEPAEDGTYSVTLDTSVVYGDDDNVLMSIGGTVSAYESFSVALQAAAENNITTLSIWLNDDITECITIPAGYNVTLDLCGYTITSAEETTIDIGQGACVTIKGGGKIINTNDTESEPQAIYVHLNATLVVENAKITGTGVGIRNSDKNTGNGSLVILNSGANVTGTSVAGVKTYGNLIVNDGATVTGAWGITFMSMDSSAYTVVTINGGTITGTTSNAISSLGSNNRGYVKLYIYDGTITSSAVGITAIYLPAQYGETYVSGGTITGVASGIEIRAGSLTITGDVTITSTYSGSKLTATANESGETVVGAAVAISQHTTEKELTVTITGGTLNGLYAVYETDTVESDDDDDTGAIAVALTEGNYNGSIGTTSVSDDSTYVLTISGGTYDEAAAESITALIASGSVNSNIDLALNEYGTYTATLYDVMVVSDSTPAYYYDSDDDGSALAQALAAIADAGEGKYTITLGSSYTYDSAITISSGYSVTLDLNGYTLTGSANVTIWVYEGGTLTIKDSSTDGEITGTYTIVNEGTLYVESGIITGTSNGIENYNTAYINGGTITGTSSAGVYNKGTVEINDGVISSDSNGIYNLENSTVEINGGEISGKFGVWNYGIVEINNGTITSTSYSYNGTAGTVDISGGEVSGKWAFATYGEMTISGGTITSTNFLEMDGGTLTISGGEISGNHGLKVNGGTVDISGGSISGSTYGVYLYNSDSLLTIKGGTITGTWGIVQYYGELTISGGTINGVNSSGTAIGVWVNSGCTANITGGTITSTSSGDYYSHGIYNYGTVNVSGDTVIISKSNTSEKWAYGIYVAEATTLTISDNVTITATNEYEDGAAAGVVYFGNKDIATPTVITISGGTIYGDTYGLSGNGSASYSSVTITGGSITGGIVGYYHPESGTLTVTGGSITGYYSALQICAGTIDITGGTFTATITSDELDECSNNVTNKSGDGVIADGAAISILDRGYSSLPSVAITGGTFTSADGIEAVQAYTFTSSSSSGTGSNVVTELSDNQTVVAVTGGTFSSPLTGAYSSYVAADGLTSTQNEDGTYGITIDNSSSATANYVGVYINGGNVVAFENLSSALEYIYGTEDGQANIDTTNDYSIVIYVYDNYTETADIEFKLGYEVTLNLNGYTLTVESGVTIANNGTLTITNLTGSGSIVLNNSYGIENYGTLYISGVTVSGVAAITAAGGKVEISGTAISGAVIVTDGTVNVYDGYITGGVIAEGGAICINSGYVYGTVTATDGTIVIYGGVILSETTDSAYFEDGYYAYLQSDGTYLVALGVYVAIPEVEEAYTYTGKEPDHGIAANDYYSITLSAYTVGIQTITLSLADGCVWADGTTADRVIYIYIAPAAITVDLPETTDYIYSTAVSVDGITAESADGTEVTIAYGLTEGTYDLADLTSINTIGSYTIYYKVTAAYHAAAEGSFTVTIAKRQITAPEADDSTYTYTGEEITYILATSDYYTISGNVQTTAGTYTVTVSLKDTTDCEWSDGTTADKTYTFVIAKYTVEIPEADGTTYTYDGSKITYALEESDYYTILNGEQTDAGTYTVTVVLNNVVNTEWSDGTKTAKQYTFVIEEAELTVSASGYSGSYDGKSHGVAVTAATVDGTAAVIVYSESLGGDYTATAPEKTDAGTYVIYYVVTAANHTSAAGYVTIEITAVSASTSENSSISGDVTSDTFVVEDITVEMSVVEEEDYEIAAETIVSTVVEAVEEVTGGEVVAVYDVTLTTSNGELTVSEATDGGSVTVKTAIPTALIGRGFCIVHIHDGEVIGILTSDDYTVANGYVSFEVSSLSQFAFVATSEEAQGTEGNTGSTDGGAADSSITTGDIVTICVLVGGTVAIVLLLAVIVWAVASRKRRS